MESRRKRRYFGMTPTEMTVIAVLGVMILCLGAVGGFFILRTALVAPPLVAEQSHLTYTPLPTYSPYPTKTPIPPTRMSLPPTATPVLTVTSEPTSTPKPTETPKPTATPRPTETRAPTQTPKPVDTTLVNYLKAFAPIANKIWATFPGDSSKVDPKSYVDIIDDLEKQLEARTVPEDAKLMYLSFQVVASEVALYHHNHAGALLFPSQSNQYMATAKSYGDSALSRYFNQYLPARDKLPESVGLSAKQVGFVE